MAKNTNREVLVARVKPDLLAWLRRAASDDNRSISAMVEVALIEMRNARQNRSVPMKVLSPPEPVKRKRVTR